MTASQQTAVLQLTPFDECDACGVQARVLIQTPRKLHLAFCKHHYEKHADQLGFSGCAVLVDERDAVPA